MRQTAPAGATSLCVSIVEAVAAERGVTPEEVTEPLYEVVDTDALERLFAPTRGDADRRGEVAFRYDGCQVVVDSEGRVTVTATSRSDTV